MCVLQSSEDISGPLSTGSGQSVKICVVIATKVMLSWLTLGLAHGWAEGLYPGSLLEVVLPSVRTFLFEML